MIPSLSASANLFLNRLSQLQSTITTATAQLTSGHRISQPSDAPDQVSPLLQLQASLSHNQAVSANLTRAQADVSSADQAVSTALKLLDQARSIGAQGANGTTTSATRANLAQQVESILEQMVALSDTQVSGRYIFSGDQDTSPPYGLDSNPPVQLTPRVPAKVIPPGDTVTFNVQLASGPLPTITITGGAAGDTLQNQLNELNIQLQGTGITASLDQSGNLQFQSSQSFSIGALANGSPSLVGTAPETANNTGLNHYEYTPQAPLQGGGNDVQIRVGATTATVTVPVAPQPADIVAINNALETGNITNVTAVLDETNGNASVSFQGSTPFSISDDHAVLGAYLPVGNSVAANGVNRLITPTATRQMELSDHSFTTVDQTAQDLFDQRNPDESPAQGNVFFALNSLRLALADNANLNQQVEINAAQTSLQAASDYLNSKETFYGNAQNRITAATDRINTENLNLQQQISDIRDTDIVETALELSSAETANQAALAAEAKVPHTSLFDFLG